MIKLYSGTPGSGKSLHMAKVIRDALKKGITVICNFHVNKELSGYSNFIFYDTYKLTPEQLYHFSDMYFKDKKSVEEDAILLIMDECHRIFNPRMWQRKDRMDWLDFFTLHRHYGYYCLLVCQFDKQIDSQLRPLIEYEAIHRKVSNFGIRGKLLSLIMGGKTFLAVNYWYPVRQYMGSEVIHGNKKIYSVYNTYNKF